MRGFSEPRLLVEVGGEMIEEPERFHAASAWKNEDATIRTVTQNPFVGQDTGRD
jgi:hypothetical protein